MINKQHSIAPPPELIEDWIEIAKPLPQRPPNPGEFATLAARWGADQELEACVEWLKANGNPRWAFALQEGRRPQPPSLKEQALAALGRLNSGALCANPMADKETIRRALEQLDD